jgi:hypothetical protein
LPTGVEQFWQKRTFLASKHLRWTNLPATLIQKVGPEYITSPCLSASRAARFVACHGVRSHPVPVALVGECSMPVV